MSKLRNLSMNGKLLLLAGVCLSLFALFGVVAFSTLNTVKVDGPHYNKIVGDKNLTADILPPPAFIVESSWVTYKLLDAKSKEQIAELKTHLQRLESEYDASLKNWSVKLEDAVLVEELLVKSQDAARSFFKTVDRELLPAIDSENYELASEVVRTKLDPDFNTHYAAISAVVERNKEVEAADQALATATVISRTRTLAGIAIALFGAVIAITLWLRKSVVAQENINADYAGQIAAIGRSQAVIEFDVNGNILHANDNFLATLGYDLSQIKGRHHSMFVEESTRNSAEYREFWPNLAKGIAVAGEFKRIGSAGKEVWVQATYNPILGTDGKPVKVVKFASNTTSQKLAELELRKNVNSILDVVESASKGDLTREVTVQGEDAIGQMGAALGQFFCDLRTNIASIAENASALAGASEELSAVSAQMSSNAEETSSQANVVSAASEQVSMNVQTVSTGVDELNAAIREIAKNASDAARVSQQAVSVVDSTNVTIAKLGDSSLEIGKVVNVITSIAEQTNLLALNATIEAARAGEAGKGFAVVANEVKELAKETAKATEDISEKINAIQADTQGAVAAIREISEVISQINDISSTIASAVEEQTATANEMGRNVGEAARGAGEIAQNITSVASAAESTTHGASNSQQAAMELSRMASELQQLVAKFTYEVPSQSSYPTASRRSVMPALRTGSTFSSAMQTL